MKSPVSSGSPPGATAHAIFAYSHVAASNCPPAVKLTAVELRVYTPDQYQANHTFWSGLACVAKGQPVLMRVDVHHVRHRCPRLERLTTKELKSGVASSGDGGASRAMPEPRGIPMAAG